MAMIGAGSEAVMTNVQTNDETNEMTNEVVTDADGSTRVIKVRRKKKRFEQPAEALIQKIQRLNSASHLHGNAFPMRLKSSLTLLLTHSSS